MLPMFVTAPRIDKTVTFSAHLLRASASFKNYSKRRTSPTPALFHTLIKTSIMEVELTAPNGIKYKQPTGLFINNEWVEPRKGEKITSINPS